MENPERFFGYLKMEVVRFFEPYECKLYHPAECAFGVDYALWFSCDSMPETTVAIRLVNDALVMELINTQWKSTSVCTAEDAGTVVQAIAEEFRKMVILDQGF
jgi:hypothetical protein